MGRKVKPFDKIFTVRAKLDMYVRYGSNALGDQSIDDFMEDVHECFGHLIVFRNIINGMVSFDQSPGVAAMAYISDEEILQAAS